LNESKAAVAEALDRNESALRTLVEAALGEIQRRPRSTSDLIEDHFALYGFPMDAEGFHDRAGAQVLAPPQEPHRAVSADWVDDLDFEYRSEEARHTAERVIETSTSSFATVNEASGAGFVGSGVGAMSLAVRYAQAKAEDRDSFEQSGSTDLTHIRTHYHRAPMQQIDFDTLDLRLSGPAQRRLVEIDRAPLAQKRRLIVQFIETFGSHVFRQMTLGGWYKRTAVATAHTLEQESSLRTAVSTAMNLAVSASASYTGLGGRGGGSSGTTQDLTLTQGNARQQTYQGMGLTVTVGTSILGGRDGLPLDYWVESVQYPSQCKVIERDRPTPVWEIIARGLPGLTSAQSGALANLFEAVWVQDWFLPSLVQVDPVLAQILKGRKLGTVRALTEALLYVPQTQGAFSVTTCSSVFTTSHSVELTSENFDVKSRSPIASFHVYWDGDKMRGFEWVDADGRSQSVGELPTDRNDDLFTFDPGETLDDFTVYIVNYGGTHRAVRGFRLFTSQGRLFQTDTRGDPIDLRGTVAGRYLMGFHGRTVGDYVVSADPWMSPTPDVWPQNQALPAVMVGEKEVKAPEAPPGQRGFRVIITDGRLPSVPSAILRDRYFGRPYAADWAEPLDAGALYDEMATAMNRPELVRQGNLLIVVSFGMALHAHPTESARIVPLLRSAGAGPGLQTWLTTAVATPRPPRGEALPANYIHTGVFGVDGTGKDLFTQERTATLVYKSAKQSAKSFA
jgi:hypothetical protein